MTISTFDGFEPKLEHIFDIHIDLEPPQIIGQTPAGVRQVYVVKAALWTARGLKEICSRAAATGAPSGRTVPFSLTCAQLSVRTTAR